MSSVTETGIPLYLEFPFHRQDYSDTCGAACAQMILDHHGIYLSPSPFAPPDPAEPPNQLTEQNDLVNVGESKVDPEEDPDSAYWIVSPSELVKILEEYGVAGYEALGWGEASATSLDDDIEDFVDTCRSAVDGMCGALYCPPMIVVDSMGHWIVLTSCVSDVTGVMGFYYHDPLLYGSGTSIPPMHFSGDLCSFDVVNGNAYITFEGLSERTSDHKIIVCWAYGNGAMARSTAANGNGAMARRTAEAHDISRIEPPDEKKILAHRADVNGAMARRTAEAHSIGRIGLAGLREVAPVTRRTAEAHSISRIELAGLREVAPVTRRNAEAPNISRIEPPDEKEILVLRLIKSVFKCVYRFVARVARAVCSILFSEWTKPQTGRLDKCQEEIAAQALSAIEKHGLNTRKGWDELLAGTSIGPPLRVRQGEQSSLSDYYVAPAQNQTGKTKMLVLMNAVTGTYWGSLIVTSGHFLFRDDPKARDLVNEVIVAIRSKLKQDGVRDTSYWEKEFVKQVNSTRPNLMWTPCQQSESLFFPFYAIQPSAKSRTVYVRVDGEVFISLTPRK